MRRQNGGIEHNQRRISPLRKPGCTTVDSIFAEHCTIAE